MTLSDSKVQNQVRQSPARRPYLGWPLSGHLMVRSDRRQGRPGEVVGNQVFLAGHEILLAR